MRPKQAKKLLPVVIAILIAVGCLTLGNLDDISDAISQDRELASNFLSDDQDVTVTTETKGAVCPETHRRNMVPTP